MIDCKMKCSSFSGSVNRTQNSELRSLFNIKYEELAT